MTVLASGSRGNCTVISSGGASILVDAGLSCRETIKRMRAAGEDPHQLKAIVISHEHSDHIAGLPVLARKLKTPVYMSEATYQSWRRFTHDAEGKPVSLERRE
ncbi:MAG TPA: MBL fold metallo-hydrolase, partial [Candidatus Angelobacter sp.]|nr:MBL fold metallo-hydrolase [Candidatus Angelobacter sp.]